MKIEEKIKKLESAKIELVTRDGLPDLAVKLLDEVIAALYRENGEEEI